MLCTNCSYHSKTWDDISRHYREKHPEIKRPDKLFTKEARNNILGKPCGCNILRGGNK